MEKYVEHKIAEDQGSIDVNKTEEQFFEKQSSTIIMVIVLTIAVVVVVSIAIV